MIEGRLLLDGMPEFVRDRVFPLGEHRHFTLALESGDKLVQHVKVCDCSCEDCMLRLLGTCVCLTHCQCENQDDHENLVRCYLNAPVQP